MVTTRLPLILSVAFFVVCLALPCHGGQFTVTEEKLQACKGACCLPQPPAGAPVLSWQAEKLESSQIRVRRPVRLAFADPEYLAKYQLAYELLAKRPGALAGQVAAHCAYCGSNAYGKNVNENDLFFPWHRWYLYWHEKLLQTLLNDTTFSLPFWDWDSQDGKKVAAEYLDTSSPLFRARGGENADSINAWIEHGSQPSMLRHQVLETPLAKDFLGSESERGQRFLDYRSGRETEFAGSDPLFYAHHANVDRMWWLWKQGPADANGRKRMESDSPRFMDSSFVFYDEHGELRRVTVRDAIDTIGLGYTYEDMPNHWMKYEDIQSTSVSGEGDEEESTDAEQSKDIIEEIGTEGGAVRERRLVEGRALWQEDDSPSYDPKVWRKLRRRERWSRRGGNARGGTYGNSPCPSRKTRPSVSNPLPIVYKHSPPPPKKYTRRSPPPPVKKNLPPYEAPSFNVGPQATTVTLRRKLPQNRPGWRPITDPAGGAMNTEAIMIKNVIYETVTPVHFNAYINNKNATCNTGTGRGFLTGWVYSSGLMGGYGGSGPGPSNVRLPIADFLDRNGLLDETVVHLTIVPYVYRGASAAPPANKCAWARSALIEYE